MEDKWIDVNETEPYLYDRVLVYLFPDDFITIINWVDDYQNDEDCVWKDEDGKWRFNEGHIVTHWMPLPNPPEIQG